MTRLQSVHPVLRVHDVSASVRFYAALGFREIFRDAPAAPKYAGMRRDAVELHLQWHASGAWDPSGDRPTYRFLVDDVDGLFDEVTTRSPDLDRTDVMDTPWGTREFHVRDLDRNGLQFYQDR